MQKRLWNNKGISPILATVLLVAFVVILGLLIWLFLSKTIKQFEGKVQCGPQEGISLDFAGECSCVSGVEPTLNVKIINNGQQKLDGILVVSRNNDGSGTGLGPSPITIESGEEDTVSYSVNGCPESAEIFPYVVKDGKSVACADQTITVTCSEL